MVEKTCGGKVPLLCTQVVGSGEKGVQVWGVGDSLSPGVIMFV